MRKILAAGAFAVFASTCAVAGTSYYWTLGRNVWGKWTAASNWLSGGTNGTVSAVYPGQTANTDEIAFWQEHLFADLDGQDLVLAGYNQNRTPRVSYGSSYLSLSNGSITVTSDYQVYNGVHYLYDASFTVLPTVASSSESPYSAGGVYWHILPGSKLVMNPKNLSMFQSYYEVASGAELDFSPGGVQISSQIWPIWWKNSGTMAITNGFDISACAEPHVENNSNSRDSAPHSYREGWRGYVALDQLAGTLRIGGLFSTGALATLGRFVEFHGGTVEVVKDTSFVGFDCRVSEGAEVEIAVADGRTMDMTSFTYGADASVVKSGDGLLVLGAALPASLDFRGGILEITDVGFDFSKVTFNGGANLCLGVAGFRIDEEPAEDLVYSIDPTRIGLGSTCFRSSSAEIRAKVRSALAAVYAGVYDFVEDGEGIIMLESSANIFDASSGKQLSDPTGWLGGTVPTGSAVLLRGSGTVTFDADSPSFASIGLELGARLEVGGGTAEAPVELPAISLNCSSTLRFAENSHVSMTNGYSATANEEALPVVEIATNAIVFVQDAAYPNRGVYFANTDFRLYGRLDLPDTTSSGDYIGSQIFFGYAGAGETTYMAFTCEGGSIYCHAQAAAYVGNRSLVSFASPAAGGRVKVVRDVVIRDFRKIHNLAYPDNPMDNDANSGYFFGYGNPEDEVFNVLVDDTLLAPGGPTRFGGGARVSFVNGSRLSRIKEQSSNQSWGHTRGAFLGGDARLSFNGGDLILERSCGSKDLGRGFDFSPTTYGTTVLTLDGGAALGLWEVSGNGNGVCESLDGIYGVSQFNPVRYSGSRSQGTLAPSYNCAITNTPAFCGFASVNLPAGGRLGFDAREDYILWYSNDDNRGDEQRGDVWWTDYFEWNRTVALEIPVTGAGELYVTNTLSGTDPRGNYLKNYPFPDLSTWSMTLIVRGSANTCSGEVRAADNCNAYVSFADGANWAGTVVANGHARLGDDIADPGSTVPATVRFANLRLEGEMPIRIWSEGNAVTNDFIEIAGDVIGRGVFVGELAGGLDPKDFKRTVPFARCPKSVEVDSHLKWQIREAEDPSNAEMKILSLRYDALGTVLIVR